MGRALEINEWARWLRQSLHMDAPSQSLVNLFLRIARKLYLRGLIKL